MEGRPSSTDGSDSPAPPSQQASGWLFPALLLVILVCLGFVALRGSPPAGGTQSSIERAWTPAPRPAGETVQLLIDFGNGATRQFDALPWSSKMTVADVLKAAEAFQPGIRFSQQGTGASGFLTSLEGVDNEGSQKRNWRFLVDGKLGETSFCIAEVQPGSSILWEYSEEY